MANALDSSVKDISGSRLKLAEELLFAPQVYGTKTHYHIEHPSRGKFYRVGYPEYVFLSLMDGTRTVAQALTVTAHMLGSCALSHVRGVEVANWLIENRLAQLSDSDAAWSAPHGEPSGGPGAILKRVNPFWMKLPFGSPDRLLTILLQSVGWCFSPWATLLGILVILFGIGSVVSHWPEFMASATSVVTPQNWLWMLLAWIGLKVIHELAHGLACKYHRGEVRETGLIFILFAPMAYVDVTSCWRFPSKWQRIHVAVAGMYSELLIAAVAAIAWTHFDSTVLHHLLFNIIVMASLSTLLFNANPLMRFDGYYILSDLLEIPNLATEGNRCVKALASRIFFGQRPRPLQDLGLRRWIVRAYGVAAACWRLLICVSLATAASVLLHGAGFLLALGGILAWFGLPLWKLIIQMHQRFHESRPTFMRATVTGAVLAASVFMVLAWAPWPGALSVPVVVNYSDDCTVRSAAPGFIEQVHVHDGQLVEAGQLLIELRNEQLVTDQRELELICSQEKVRRRVALDQRNGAAAQIAQRNHQAALERLEETRQRTEGLQIRAPIAGRVVARNLPQSVGTYVAEGDEILSVADESGKELVVSVAQEQIDTIMPRVGDSIRFRIGDRWARVGTLDRLDPRASTNLPHPAMSASVGGPLAVTQGDAQSEAQMRLAESRFRGTVALTSAVCQDLGGGEQGYAMFGLRRESVGEFLWVRLHRWCESLLRPAGV